MDTTIVIKVKYGKTLRRFNARIDEAGNLDLSLNGLLEKVLSMFSLSPDADVTLTYLDEDGDSITLADNEDLKDVVRQSLNPLRITVKANSVNPSITSSARSSGNSTPMRSSSRVSQPLPDFSNTVSEILKAVPEPLGEALTKLTRDVASKATASSPQLPELVQQFSKMLQSYMVPVSESSTPPPVAKEPEASGGDSAKAKATAVPDSVNQPVDSVSDPPRKNTFVAPEFSSLNIGAEEGVIKSGESSSCAKGDFSGKPDWGNIREVVSSVFDADDVDVTRLSRESSPPGVGRCPYFKTSVESAIPFERSFTHGNILGVIHLGVRCDGCGVNPICGPRFKSKVKENYDLCRTCFEEMGSEADYIRMDGPVYRHPHCGVDGISHFGVECDHCGVNPISGPRFESKVRENYDLCGICFDKMGSEADYIRRDRPVYRHPHIHKKLHDLNARVNPPTLPRVLQGVVKQNESKLDSRFIMDVNVMDGTVMAPSTPFTKIWRMRNNGTLVWPQGTQVVWIGGEKLSASLSAGLQIPGEGLAVENELEIAVDFKAPEHPGRYISYWRMASPSGEKFGQRIWVLIQVDASTKDSAPSDNWPVFNLNFPPESSSMNKPESESNNVAPTVINGCLPINEPSNKATDLVEPLVDSHPTKYQDHDFPINDNLLVNGTSGLIWGTPQTGPYPTVSSPVIPPPVPFMWGGEHVPSFGSSIFQKPRPYTWGRPPTVSYPKVDSSSVPLSMPPVSASVPPPMLPVSAVVPPPMPPASAAVPPPMTPASAAVPLPLPPASAEPATHNGGKYDDVEQILLLELEEMGFKRRDLNKEILRKNNYDLEQSVETLCGVSEWDPILEELQEMGFYDNELNKKLLKKNNGSIKDVVMDLIGGEKA